MIFEGLDFGPAPLFFGQKMPPERAAICLVEISMMKSRSG